MEASNSWKRGFEWARVAATHSNHKSACKRVGAVIVSGSRLISIGYGLFDKSHPQNKKYEKTVHAEQMAIIRRKFYDDSNLVMYTYRETVYGPGMSKPCPMCQEFIKLSRIKKVRFINMQGQPEEMRFD